jgi:hypothetical protein
MFPLMDNNIREKLRVVQAQLHTHLNGLKIQKYSSFIALHGTSRASSTASLIVLTPDPAQVTNLFTIPDDMKIIVLRFESQPSSENTLLRGYSLTPVPGTIIGASARPDTSFTAGWWVRDCRSGSVFNLTTAHPLRASTLSTSSTWSIKEEGNNPLTVDCPPTAIINATSLALRQDIQQMERNKADRADIEVKIKKLRDIVACSTKKELATVVSAGYGEFQYQSMDDGEVTMIEDWALLRAKTYRVGRNEIRSNSDDFTRKFTGCGDLTVGARVIMNGATSGIREGVVMDRVIDRVDNHDKDTYCWIVTEKYGGEFSHDGDSGAPIGLENGLAGGILTSEGIGVWEDGEKFPISYICGLRETFKRIKDVTGRELEIPSVYDLSRKEYRDRYHYAKTGQIRRRDLG